MPTLEAVRLQERRWRFLLIAILALAMLLRLWGMGFGLPQKVHPDEPLLADRAVDALVTGNFNPAFFHWPSFMIYFLFFIYLIVYSIGHIAGIYPDTHAFFQSYYSNPTTYFWIGRMTTSLFCIAGMSWLYLIGKRIAGRAAGLAAATLMGFNALTVENSRYITPDIPAMSLMIYVWFCLLDYLDSGRLRMLYAAAFVGGVAVSTKYNAALLLVPILITAASRVQHWPAGEVPKLSRRAGVYLSACLLLFALGFFLFTPYSLLDSPQFLHQLQVQFTHQTAGHIGMEARGSSLLSILAYFYSPYGLIILILTLAGLGALTRPLLRGMVLLSFPVLYLLSISGWVVWAERYLLLLLPTCFLAGGISLGWIAERVLPRKKELAALIMALLVTLPSLYQAIRHASDISRPHTRVVALRWIEENIAPRSYLIIEKGAPEPHHVDEVEAFDLNVSPVFFFPEQELTFNPQNAGDAPLVRLRKLSPPPQYIISSAETHDRYFDPRTQAKYPELTGPWIEYYEFIETHCVLLYEVNPDHVYWGPWIKVWRVPHGAMAASQQ